MRDSVTIVLMLIFLSCGDILAPGKDLPGPYYLGERDDGTWTLYYELDDAGIGRVNLVEKAGWTGKYLLAEGEKGYYIIDKEKDGPFLNSEDIALGPFSESAFRNLLDSLNISNFQFQIDLR